MFNRSIWALVTFMMVIGCSRYYHGDKSDHFNGAHFFNPGKPMEKEFTIECFNWPTTAMNIPLKC